MAGNDAPYVPGWDTHGLPIEQQAIKELGLDRRVMNPVEFRQKCKEFALKFVNIQREEFKRLGISGNWKKPYLTLHPNYEAVQIGVFAEMVKRGYIYKGLKPVFWCAYCETALAEAEVEYQDKKSPAIYVKFPVKDGQGLLPEENTSIINPRRRKISGGGRTIIFFCPGNRAAKFKDNPGIPWSRTGRYSLLPSFLRPGINCCFR